MSDRLMTPEAMTPPAAGDGLPAFATAVAAAAAREQRHLAALLFAAVSLKGSPTEGGLPGDQAAANRRWKAQLWADADASLRRLGHLAAANAAVGAVAPGATASPTTEELPPAAAAPAVFAALAETAATRPDAALRAMATRLADGASRVGETPPPAATVDWAAVLAALDALAADAAPDLNPDAPDPEREFAEAMEQARATGADLRPVRQGPAAAAVGVDGTPAPGPSAQATDDVAKLLVAAYALTLDAAAADEPLAVAARLFRGVIRPLAEALARTTVDLPWFAGARPERRPPLADGELSTRLVGLATALTARWAADDGPCPAEVGEAAAACQWLALDAAAANGSDSGSLLDALAATQNRLPGDLRLVPNGPVVATNLSAVADWLGQDLPTRPTVAFCRCGHSAAKPWCDGSHALAGFDDAKDPNRVPDRRDRYDGVQVTVLDNRGLCAHSGFCTDRLASVFHQGSDPFVTPSGGRLDEIIRAVRDCPSGALSLAIDGRERRADVDQPRSPAIEISKDGPYRITGSIPLGDGDGHPIERNRGASLEHYSLCRCGHSRNKPFCSGMHWYADFHDPVPAADRPPTLFEWAGGFPALLRMTRRFYEKHVPEDPFLAPLFADMSPDHPQRVAAWLGEVFGGPRRYSERYGGQQGGYARMLSQHLGKNLQEAWRARWVQLLSRSADEAGLPTDPEFRSAFAAYLEWGSRLALENSQTGSQPPPRMPVPRWDWGTAGPPGGRISALAPPVPAPEVALPGPDEPVTFAHVKPLFRQSDRDSMRWAFDLWSYDDLRDHAEAILARVRAGDMPCDGAWPPARVAVLQRWIDGGCPA
jgi:CDGSH-type Zn-finger protein/truncated hemoglobin YjbI